ncbi:GAF domain-containing protein [Winogradskyella litorisediminis]
MKVSFDKLLCKYEELIHDDNDFIASNAKRVLKIANNNPVLRGGFSETKIFKEYEKEISGILQDAFNPILSSNEIKTASIPFHNLIFNKSERFKSIIKNAGNNFEPELLNMPESQRYIIACNIILNFCYGYDINFKRPFLYEIPDENGVTRYYKILYNADFVEVKPKPSAPKITQKDYNELLDNFENIEMWKEKFPPNSYEFNGFVISNIFDVTDDQSISNIKSTLIGSEKRKNKSFVKDFRDVFQSLFGIKDIEVGFSLYNPMDDKFERIYGAGMNSYLLNDFDTAQCSDTLCEWSYHKLLIEKDIFSISDIDSAYKISEGKNVPHISVLHKQGIKSAIFAPIANETGLMGVLEIVSKNPQELNSINANKLVDVMPFIVSAVERSKEEEANKIQAVIQQECTSIHPSVHWRFVQEAKSFINQQLQGEEPSFKKIAFDNVYPLYGQIDVKGSSEARNFATKMDLEIQLNQIKSVIKRASELDNLPIYQQFVFQIEKYLTEVKNNFQVDTEQKVTSFIDEDIDPVLKHLKTDSKLNSEIELYFNSIDNQTGAVYIHRKKYDDTIALVNREMAAFLDSKQADAQKMYPHYYERYKTDGVEHNMYIGEAITKEDSFNPVYLYNLRLWQMQVMIEMENAYYQMQSNSKFPMKLDVASMILVFSQPLSISFRMDEKHFDVDGTYNARYEIVKKRVDKAFIKGTEERITQKGKITVVYSQKEDEQEYLRYVRFLQDKKYLDTDVEILELEDLQAVTGLKAIRVSVLYHKSEDDKDYYTYEDLMQEINA